MQSILLVLTRMISSRERMYARSVWRISLTTNVQCLGHAFMIFCCHSALSRSILKCADLALPAMEDLFGNMLGSLVIAVTSEVLIRPWAPR